MRLGQSQTGLSLYPTIVTPPSPPPPAPVPGPFVPVDLSSPQAKKSIRGVIEVPQRSPLYMPAGGGGGGGGNFTVLHFDTTQTSPISTTKTGDGAAAWQVADDFDPAVDNPSLSVCTYHSRVGTQCYRAQLTCTKTLVGGVYTQYVPNPGHLTTESAHRTEINETGLPTWPPTQWNRLRHMLTEYFDCFSYYIPGPGDPHGDPAFPQGSGPDTGYVILWQGHDTSASPGSGAGPNPLLTLNMSPPTATPNGNRTNFWLSSASRTVAGPHTAKTYDLGPWTGMTGEWIDFTIRWKPDWVQYTGPINGANPVNCQGLVQVWGSSRVWGTNKLLLSQPTATANSNGWPVMPPNTFGWPNAGEPVQPLPAPDMAPYVLPWAIYTQPKDPTTTPLANYPHQYVYFLGWSKTVKIVGYPQAEVTPSNAGFIAVQPPTPRTSGF